LPETLILLFLAAVVIVAVVTVSIIALRREKLLRASLAERERLLGRLVERFGEMPELVAFAASPEAERLFQATDGPTALARRLLSLTAVAVALSAVGVAFLINSFAPLPSPDINYVREALEDRWWAVMFLALGLGVGVAVAVCARLARRWGLLP
jgi:ABC-type multidrug transport system fused ATPase/permease subunit